jgi:(p)ppGpp synthase/HD superfamily hydrolase
MSVKSRLAELESQLSKLGYNDALRAMDWMVEEMSVAKGFERHNGDDYFIHPIDCAQDLINHGIRDEPAIIVSLLHDAPEDIPGVTVKMVETMFTTQIAVAVDLLTKKPGIDYKLDENMSAYLAPILQNWRSLLGKASDRKNNCETLNDATVEKQFKQAVETDLWFFPLFKEGRKLYPRFAPYFVSATRSIKPHLQKIREYHDLHQRYIALGGK